VKSVPNFAWKRCSSLDLVRRGLPTSVLRRWRAARALECEPDINSLQRSNSPDQQLRAGMAADGKQLMDAKAGTGPSVVLVGGGSSSRWILARIGAAAGLASGLFGVGGGFLIVPLQLLWTRVDSRRASGTSMAAILPIAFVGATAYYFGRIPGQVDFRVALFLAIGSMSGAYLGARVIGRVPDRILTMVVTAVLVVVGLDEIVSGLLPGQLLAGHHVAPTVLAAWQYGLIVAAGLFIGALSAIIGVGGGIFMVPAMVIGVGLDHHLAQGTSLVAILPTATVGAITHFRHGNVVVRNAIWIGAAGVPLALAGSALALSLPQAILAVLFGFLLLFAARRIWLRGKSGVSSGANRPQTTDI
jgi:uncharacterized protein